jgi:hypothetical protein
MEETLTALPATKPPKQWKLQKASSISPRWTGGLLEATVWIRVCAYTRLKVKRNHQKLLT